MRHTQRLFAAGLALATLGTAAPAATAQEPTVYTITREAGRGGWLGIAFAWGDGAPEQMRITQVFPGSPAAGAGVRQGDVVLRIGTRPATEAAMAEVRTRLSAGDTLRLRVRRDGGERDVALVAAARPARQAFVERILRMEGDTLPRMRVMQLDSVLRRMELDSMIHRDMRNLVIRIQGDSLRAVADSLLVRVDTLRRRFTIRNRAGQPRTFSFPPVDSATLKRMVETASLLEERIALGEALSLDGGIRIADGRPFFLEVGRRALAGAELTPMNEGLARYFTAREGLLVTRVSPESPAGRAGLEAGDVVVRVGGQAVATVDELREAVRRARGGRLPLEVMRGRRRQTVELTWDAEAPRVRTFTRTLPGRETGAPQR